MLSTPGPKNIWPRHFTIMTVWHSLSIVSHGNCLVEVIKRSWSDQRLEFIFNILNQSLECVRVYLVVDKLVHLLHAYNRGCYISSYLLYVIFFIIYCMLLVFFKRPLICLTFFNQRSSISLFLFNDCCIVI